MAGGWGPEDPRNPAIAGLPTPPAPPAAPAPARAPDALTPAASEHPVQLLVMADDELRRSRLTVFFRLLLVIPHLLILSVFGLIALVALPIQWLIVLIAGRSTGMDGMYRMLIRTSVQVYAYLFIVANPYPQFLGDRYPIDVRFPEPGLPQNRWMVFFRGVLGVPVLLVAAALGAGSSAGLAGVGGTSVLLVVAFLGWFTGLFAGRMPRGMRELGVWALGYSTQAYAYLLLITDVYPDSDPATYPLEPLPEHPVTLEDREGDEGLRRSRLTVFLRLPLAFPHIVWLLLWSVVAAPVVLIGWFAALFTARIPHWAHRFLAALLRYATNVSAFLYLGANPFPGFTGTSGAYVIELGLPERERHNRWTVLFRGLLGVPALLLGGAIGGVALVATVLGWFTGLFVARTPRGLRNVILFSLRYSAQSTAYLYLLTPTYPYSGPDPCRTSLPPTLPSPPQAPSPAAPEPA